MTGRILLNLLVLVSLMTSGCHRLCHSRCRHEVVINNSVDDIEEFESHMQQYRDVGSLNASAYNGRKFVQQMSAESPAQFPSIHPADPSPRSGKTTRNLFD